MSKLNTARSRAEKNRINTNIILTTVSNDIVLGKYNDYDWNLTLDRETSEECINVIVEGILKGVEQNIYEIYLKSRVIHHTMELAKKAMIKIVEWDFLRHDFGEGDRFENVWMEDGEAESCKIDSWAQGYFPKRQNSFLYSREDINFDEYLNDEISKLEESEEYVEKNIHDYIGDFEFCEVHSLDNKQLNESVESNHEQIQELQDKNVLLLKNICSSKKCKFKPYRGKIKYNDLDILTETLYETEMRFELEKNRMNAKLNRGTSSQSTTSRQENVVDYEKKVIQKFFQTSVKDYKSLRTRDILLNGNEQLVTLMKIPTEQLMAQRVKANPKMLEGVSNKSIIFKEAIGHGKHIENPIISDVIRTPSIQGNKYPLPISMLDSIDPVPGVIVQEGDRIKKSVNKKFNRTKQIEKQFFKLRPIGAQKTKTSYLIQDLIDANRIQIKPIATSTPIPDIISGFSRSERNV